MGYVRNLIPKHSRVELDGKFEHIESSYGPAQSEGSGQVTQVILYILSTFFFLAGFAGLFSDFWAGLCFLLIGFVLLPQGALLIENRLPVKFSWLGKTVVVVVLFIIAGAVLPPDKPDENAIALIEKKQEDDKRTREIEAKNEKQRIDSLNYFLTKAEKTYKKSPKSAIFHLNSALKFSINETNELLHKRATWQSKANRFKDAVDDYTLLIKNSYNISDTYCERAVCLNKLKKKPEAVADLRTAINYGNPRAQKLYDQINPVKRRVIDYITRCCDGTSSNAKGQGACSHHGGVCDWNEPVYEEYREY